MDTWHLRTDMGILAASEIRGTWGITQGVVLAFGMSAPMVEIKDDIEKLVRVVARRTGKTPEEVVRDAVEASARALGMFAPEPQDSDSNAMITAATKVVVLSVSRPILDARSADEILGYDENGVPS